MYILKTNFKNWHNYYMDIKKLELRVDFYFENIVNVLL